MLKRQLEKEPMKRIVRRLDIDYGVRVKMDLWDYSMNDTI